MSVNVSLLYLGTLLEYQLPFLTSLFLLVTGLLFVSELSQCTTHYHLP